MLCVRWVVAALLLTTGSALRVTEVRAASAAVVEDASTGMTAPARRDLPPSAGFPGILKAPVSSQPATPDSTTFEPGPASANKLFGVPGGCNGFVTAIAVGSNGKIFLGGDFTTCEQTVAFHVVEYDPVLRTFRALGQGAANGVNGRVQAIAFYNDQLYVGGYFDRAGAVSANSVARWDGQAWHSLGTGTANGVSVPASSFRRASVAALAVHRGDLYLGGEFTSAGGRSVNHIARWNGAEFHPLAGPGGVVGVAAVGFSTLAVNALASGADGLYVGGDFNQAGGLLANRVARWDGTTWHSLTGGGSSTFNGVSGGAYPIVYTLAVSGTDVYVGGAFEFAGEVSAISIARWDGQTWHSLGAGAQNGVTSATREVYALTVANGMVYAGGRFTSIGGVAAAFIGRWNGSAWAAIGGGLDNSVFVLASSGANVHAGGAFATAGGASASRVATFSNDTWSNLGGTNGNGVDGNITSLAFWNDNLYVGGDFRRAGGQVVNFVARWNGSSWAPLASGLNGRVNALAVGVDGLYVGGEFTRASSVTANNVVRWDGTRWQEMVGGVTAGVGFGARVLSLAVRGRDVYVGGYFFEAGGQPARSIVRWDGSFWVALGSGLSGNSISSIAFRGTTIHVGAFQSVRAFDGSAWTTVGSVSGGDQSIHALHVIGNDLYAAGSFTAINGVSARNIARWNGSEWRPLAAAGTDGTNDSVRALASNGSELIVGGGFIEAGGVPAGGLALWTGTEWRALGSPDNRQVISAITRDAASLYAGGSGLTQTPLANLESVAASGALANGASRNVSLARIGNRVAFQSEASNLVAGDSNARADVFVRDSASGTTTRVSAAAEAINGGTQESFSDPALSADGARVAFAGSAGQVYAVVAGQGRVLSRSAGGALGNGPSGKANLPGGGNLAYFESQATNLLPAADGNGSVADIFVTNLTTGAVTLVTSGSNGEPANGASTAPWASDDGQTIAFSTLATNIVPGSVALPAGIKNGTILQATVMRESGRSRFYVSRNLSTGQVGNGNSINLRITPDGRYGVFESVATNLVDGDSNNASDIFRFEIVGNAVTRLERVSVSRYGFQANAASKNASISDDGQFITFETDASNLIELDRNETTDILVKWMVTGEVVRLSRTVDGNQPNGPSVQPTISGDGGTVVFGSGASNLTPGDLNNVQDVFSVALRERGPALVTGPLDEPGLSQFALPTPDPANANCPSGFFSAVVDDGPGSGLTAGAFGMEVLLDEPGTRVLAGGLNFGGLIDAGQVGFAGFTIANAANESQRLNLSLTGSPSTGSTQSLPVRIRIARRTATTSETVFESTQTISLASPYLASIDLPPAFYEATVAPVSGNAGGAPEGQFFFSLTTSFINRPGGGFQGGAVVGGYHAAHPFNGVSGFAGFCLATPHATTIRVLSRPSYGPTGAQDLRLRVQDAQQRDLVVVPAG